MEPRPRIVHEAAALAFRCQGRPSAGPEALFKIVLIQHSYGITSLRQTLAEINMNKAYRWFFGYSVNEETPHFLQWAITSRTAMYWNQQQLLAMFTAARLLMPFTAMWFRHSLR